MAQPNQALEQTRDDVLRYGEIVGCELLNFVVRRYSHNTFMNSSDATADQLAAFEQQNCLSLPGDYRDYLLRTGGGRVHPNASWVSDINDYVLVDYLYGLSGPRSLTLQCWLDEYRDEMPSGALIIGGDPGGAFFILITDGAESGIYLWDHQHWYPGSSEEKGNTFLLAHSFSAWLNSLCELPGANSRNT